MGMAEYKTTLRTLRFEQEDKKKRSTELGEWAQTCSLCTNNARVYAVMPRTNIP